MCIIMCGDKSFHLYLNNGSTIKNKFFKHGGEGFKLSHLHLKVVGLGGLSF
jgi:hypothetical protein